MRFKQVMHGMLLFSVLACLLALSPAAAQAPPDAQSPGKESAGAPAIVFETREHDFGTAQPNTPLTHSFVFSNRGTAALLIKNIKSG